MSWPNVSVNINNVSMDYFLRGVDAVKQEPLPLMPGAEQAPVAVPDENFAKASNMVAKLDVLLLKAAKSSTQSLDGKQVKADFQMLVDQGVLGADSLKLLAKAADNASKTMKALDKFKGSDLAKAFDANGNFVSSSKTGKAIDAAVKAQLDLSELMAQLSDNLGTIAAHTGQHGDLADKALDSRLLCDRRATEIRALASQMRDFAKIAAANGKATDPNVVAILKAKVNELLPRQALAMHGTADALSTLNASVAKSLEPLAARIDAFRTNPTASIDKAEIEKIKGEIATMKGAIEDIRKNGVAVDGGSRMMVAKDVMEGLESALKGVELMFDQAKRVVGEKVLENYLNTAVSLFSLDEVTEEQRARTDTSHLKVLNARTDFLDAMYKLAKGAMDPKVKGDELNAQIRELFALGRQMHKAAVKATPLPAQSGAEFNALLRRCAGYKALVWGLIEAINNLRAGREITNSEAMSLFEGTVSVSSIVEARARGLEDSDVNPANEDGNIVAEKQLGQGMAGTVYKLTRTDGTSVVFKGEAESRTGLASISAGADGSYADTQKAANLNISSKIAAKALGTGELIVDYSVGVHKGAFGFYMETAKGVTGAAFRKGRGAGAPDAGLSVGEIKKLPDAQRKRVIADIKRELNRLQWVDLVTGQLDRHNENYFVHVDPTTQKVTVKGIDNDASFSQYRIGIDKFAFDKERTELFKQQLEELAKSVDSRNAKAVVARMMTDPGITVDAKGNVTVDVSKLKDKSIIFPLMEVTGAQSLARPDKIDVKTYESLMALKEGSAKRDEYLNSIRPRLSDASYKAAVSRLDDAIAHADKLKEDGKVIDDEGWLDVAEEPPKKDEVTSKKLNGAEKSLGGTIAKAVNSESCPSYFARDGFDQVLR